MTNWKPIEEVDFDNPIWVLKYDIFFAPGSGVFCTADTPGARKFTDCHGWYDDEDEAIEVRNHFSNPDHYTIEKVYKRVLLRNKPDPYSCAMCNGIPPYPGSPCGIQTCPYKKA